MLYQIIELIVRTVAVVLGTSLLLRAYLQRVGAGRNPLAQFAIAITNWIVLPLRRVIPPRRGVDWASLIAAVLIAIAEVTLLSLAVSALAGVFYFDPASLFVSALIELIRWAIWLAIGLTLLWSIISWVNPESPLGPVLDVIVSPLLRPIRRVLPRVGGIDLSPIVLIVLLLIAQIVLENGAVQLLRMI